MKNKIIVEKLIKYISKIIGYTKDTNYKDFSQNTVSFGDVHFLALFY